MPLCHQVGIRWQEGLDSEPHFDTEAQGDLVLSLATQKRMASVQTLSLCSVHYGKLGLWTLSRIYPVLLSSTSVSQKAGDCTSF